MIDLPDQTKGLIAYINARLVIDEAADKEGIAASGATAEVAADWFWVRDHKQHRRAITDLLRTTEKVTDARLRQSLLIHVAARWLERRPLVDRRGLPYTSNSGGLTYLTPCCKATPTYSMGLLCCRACYEAVDEMLAATPDAAPTDQLYRPQPAQPPVGAGVCDRCNEWDAQPTVHVRCPRCGQPWARVIETGVPA